MNVNICIRNNDGEILAEKNGSDEVFLIYKGLYKPGDVISIKSDEKSFVVMTLDATLGETFAYLCGEYKFTIPFDEAKKSYNPNGFNGDRHYLHVRKAFIDEVKARKNLAYNPYDCHENSCLYPHSFANVETRGESVFASRNAIDGLVANDMHGEWPWTSWGINKNPLAEFHLDFGRSVKIDRIVIYLRADFPHDGCWKSGKITFSDNSVLNLEFKESGEAQIFDFDSKIVSSLKLNELVKYDEHSPFPALSQLMVFGSEV